VIAEAPQRSFKLSRPGMAA